MSSLPALSSTAASHDLSQIPLFAELDQEIRASFENLTQRKSWEKGVPILNNGESSDKVYFLLQGSVDIIDEFGVLIDRITNTGDVFGEVGLIEGVPRTATVQATQPTTTLSLNKQAFDSLLKQCPGVHAQMTRIAKERMQSFLMRTVLA